VVSEGAAIGLDLGSVALCPNIILPMLHRLTDGLAIWRYGDNCFFQISGKMGLAALNLPDSQILIGNLNTATRSVRFNT
jgi:hypothetical protein